MRLSTLMMSLLLGACTISSTGEEPTSVQCTTGSDGEMICTQNGGEEDQPGTGDEGDQPGDPGTAASCSSEECVIHCEEGGTNEDGTESEVQHCVIECANGLRCDQVCNGESCALYCTCPDGGGDVPDPGCQDGTEGCEEPPQPCDGTSDTEGCQPGGDWCEQNPDSTECQPDDGTGGECDPEDPACCTHPDEQSHEEYCQENPGSPEC